MLITSIFFLLFSTLVVSKEWSYLNMKQWGRKNRYCAGNLQSPIDIRFNISQFNNRLKPMILEERTTYGNPTLINNGYTAQLNFNGSYVLKNVVPFSEEYNVQQIHFHWSQLSDQTNGSEHLLDGRPFPFEMHMVTYSSDYSSIVEAMTNIRGLAVVGTFFELSEEPNPLLQPLIDALVHIRHPHSSVVLTKTFDLPSLIGEDRLERYYRYDGSLTTPPCYESVVWSVIQEPAKMSISQLMSFKRLLNAKNEPMHDIYRNVQSLGHRILFRSFFDHDRKGKMSSESNSGDKSTMNIKLFLLVMFFFVTNL